MTGLAGKVALVTGGAGGLGAAVCRQLAAAGSSVVATDVAADRLDAFARGVDGDIVTVVHDVTDEGSWDAALDEAQERFGGLDMLVNNAGVASLGAAVELTREAVERVVQVNQIGPWLGMRSAIPLFAERGGGAIVNVASVDGRMGTPGLSHYVATKHALVGMTKSIAMEVAPLGIRVNAVSPGGMDTDILKHAGMGEIDLAAVMSAKVPQQRIGDCEEIARVVGFLLSDHAAYVTGADWVVDGGLSAGITII